MGERGGEAAILGFHLWGLEHLDFLECDLKLFQLHASFLTPVLFELFKEQFPNGMDYAVYGTTRYYYELRTTDRWTAVDRGVVRVLLS